MIGLDETDPLTGTLGDVIASRFGVQKGMIGRSYLERGEPVTVVLRADWRAGGPRNVLIRRRDGQLVVRPFRGLRRLPSSHA